MVSKRKRRKKSDKKIGKEKSIVILSLVAIILIISALTIYFIQFHNPQRVQKKPAEEYFKVLDPTVLIGEPLRENTWKLSFISFQLQAIGGDANNVVIKSWAMSDPQELEDIPENESKPVLLQAPDPHGYVVKTDSEGTLPVTIAVTSDEAEGDITILFSPPG